MTLAEYSGIGLDMHPESFPTNPEKFEDWVPRWRLKITSSPGRVFHQTNGGHHVNL